MPAAQSQDSGCTQRLAVDPVTGIADCTTCGYHGRPILHLAYSIGRAAGLNPARAYLYAHANTAYLTEALATGKTRADVARDLTTSAAAEAARRPRARHGVR